VGGMSGGLQGEPAGMPQRSEPLLFGEAPRARALPFLALVDAPTPVEPLWSARAGLRDGLWQKRDDLASTRYGGNKVRRFEWLLADALDRGARTLVTAGGYASTQVTATVLHGTAHGLDVEAVLFEQPMTDFAREALALDVAAHAPGDDSPGAAPDAATGVTLFDGRSYARTAWRLAQRMRAARRPYLVLPGASSPLPNLGYVDAMLELAEQVARGECPRPDRIIVPTGSGGTVVGLALGAALLGWPTVITAVRITEPYVTNRFSLAALLYATRRRLVTLGVRGARRLEDARVEVDGSFLGEGYGFPTAQTPEGMALTEELIGKPGEVTYSGKGLAALASWSRRAPREEILYWHTLSSTGRDPGASSRAAPPQLPEELRRVFKGAVVG